MTTSSVLFLLVAAALFIPFALAFFPFQEMAKRNHLQMVRFNQDHENLPTMETRMELLARDTSVIRETLLRMENTIKENHNEWKEQIKELGNKIDARFDKIDARFDKVEAKLGGILLILFTVVWFVLMNFPSLLGILTKVWD